MIRVEAQEVYGVDLAYSEVAVTFGGSADIDVNYKITLNQGRVIVDLSLKGTFVESQLLGKKLIKGKALQQLESMYRKDIRDLVSKERGIDTLKIDDLFFNFKEYLKKVSDFDKFNKFLNSGVKKFVKVNFDLLEELTSFHNANVTGEVKTPFGKIEFIYVPEVDVEFGLLFKEGKIYVAKRVYDKYVKQLKQRVKNGGKQV